MAESPDIIKLANTIIRGQKAITFPLKIANGWVSDAKGHHILDIRGWGFIQYHSEGSEAAAQFQDELGEWIVQTLNNMYEVEDESRS